MQRQKQQRLQQHDEAHMCVVPEACNGRGQGGGAAAGSCRHACAVTKRAGCCRMCGSSQTPLCLACLQKVCPVTCMLLLQCQRSGFQCSLLLFCCIIVNCT
jgi:hypothetical protein